MKLEKAIEILDTYQVIGEAPCPPALDDALRLGIEALKWRALMEEDYGSWCGLPLLGETMD